MPFTDYIFDLHKRQKSFGQIKSLDPKLGGCPDAVSCMPGILDYTHGRRKDFFQGETIVNFSKSSQKEFFQGSQNW